MRKLNIVTGVQTRDDYPYGRLKCTISFMVEFVKGKGFRWVSQTVNPKTLRVNAPKKSVYSEFMVQHLDENGYNKPFGMSLYSYESIDELCKFFKLNPDVVFTEEESQDIWTSCISCIKTNAMYTRRKQGVSVSDFLTVTKVSEMIGMYGKHEPINNIVNIGYNLGEILNLKEIY